jgi:CHASE2 domain-containing sensor protein
VEVGFKTGTRKVFTWCWTKLTDKGLFYWITVVLLIAFGVWAGEKLEARHFAMEKRYELYQFMTHRIPNKPYAERTRMVLISDEEFWRGEMANRLPLDRNYLARLLHKLKDADPAVIAFDLNFQSPMPDGTLNVNPKYATETQNFLNKVKEVSHGQKGIPIVLPKTVRFRDGYYFTESDVFDGFDFGDSKVSFGHILLPFDYRKVPLALMMKNGDSIDSFAEAIVRIDNSQALTAISGEGKLPFGYYLYESQFPRVFARQVLNSDDTVFPTLNKKIVIVGGVWSPNSYGRGEQVDTRFTPAGPLPGAVMHANFVESLLHRLTYEPSHHRAVIVFDIILALTVAIVFAFTPGEPRQWLILKPLLVVFILVLLFAVSYLLWRNLGLFYDSFIPGTLVLGHGAYEQIREWSSATGVGKGE